MWKRDEPSKTHPSASGPGDRVGAVAIPKPAVQSTGSTSEQMGREAVNIGKSVIIKGELSGSEDLTIEGKVDGQIELREHVLTIGPNGNIKAQVFAKAVVVMGNVKGNISASEKINIRENGSVEGDISSPTVAIAEGAHFKGSIDMQRPSASQTTPARTKPTEATQASEPANLDRRAVAAAQAVRAAH